MRRRDMVLETFPPYPIAVPFALVNNASEDVKLPFGWKSDDATGVFCYVEQRRLPEPDQPDLDLGTGPIALYNSFALRDETKYERDEDVMALLRIVAGSGDEKLFVETTRFMDWSRCPATDFIEAVRLALRAGAHLAARNLAAKGAQRYPHDPSLQKMNRLLSPPRVLKTNLSPVPSLKANREWMQAHAAEYRGQWVALREGKLVARAPTARELKAQVECGKGVLITKVV
jgi:hypothetical protein